MRVFILSSCMFLFSGCDQNRIEERMFHVGETTREDAGTSSANFIQGSRTPAQDYRLATEIRLMMMEDPLIREVVSEIELSVVEGTVRVLGGVESIPIREQVERLVRSVDGVTEVIVQLNVLFPRESADEVTANNPVQVSPVIEETEERDEQDPSTGTVEVLEAERDESALSQEFQEIAATESEVDEKVEYTVQEGESLWIIAREQLGAGKYWPQLLHLNREQLGDDPEHVYPGMVLIIPVLE
jgi:hypothetical protein